jgi:hypothetical protein
VSQLLIDRPELTLDPEGLTPESENRLLDTLGQMTAALGQALLEQQVSGAEQAQPGIVAVVNHLASLAGFCQEVTYLTAADTPRATLNIEGVFAEAVELASCLHRVAGEEAALRLHELFHGNQLISLTVRRDVTASELARFLALAAPTLPGLGSDSPAPPPSTRLGESLAAAGVTGISVLDREDLIPAKLGLSWRTRIAITRLSRGLRDLPRRAQATGREASQVKVAMMRETIFPLRADATLTEFVLNVDLARTAGAHLERLDIQGDVITVLTTQQARAVAGQLVHQLTGREAGNVDFTWRERDLTLLRRCLPRLGDLLDEDAVEILRRAVESNLLPAAELPAYLRDVLDPERLTTSFLANPTLSLARLRAVRDLETFRQYASSFASITSELCRRRQFVWASNVAEVLAELASPASPASPRVKQLAARACVASVSVANLDRMALALGKLPQEERTGVLAILGRSAPTAAPLLIRRLYQNRDDAMRASLRAMVASLGKTALPLVTLVLERRQLRPETARDFLMVLATMKDAGAYDLAAGYLAADHPRARHAALLAVHRMDSARAEPALLAALADPSFAVQTAAVEALGSLRSRDPAFIGFLAELFEGKVQARLIAGPPKSNPREIAGEIAAYYQLATSGCAAVASLAQRGDIDLSELEQPLMRALKKIDGALLSLAQRALGKGPEFGREFGRIEEQRTGTALALVTALAWVGTVACLPVLRDAGKYPDPRVERLAARAIAEITARPA